jgi:hypothetical protein
MRANIYKLCSISSFCFDLFPSNFYLVDLDIMKPEIQLFNAFGVKSFTHEEAGQELRLLRKDLAILLGRLVANRRLRAFDYPEGRRFRVCLPQKQG